MSVAAPADWEGNPDSLPNIVSSTDLFDGEIFGDELIDIYNNSVDGNAQGQEITHFLPPPAPVSSSTIKKEGSGEMINGVDSDGFGAFRPSTSFNDLTALLASTNEANENQESEENESRQDQTTKKTKKRSSSGSAPSPKRKSATRRVGSQKKDTNTFKELVQASLESKQQQQQPAATAPVEDVKSLLSPKTVQAAAAAASAIANATAQKPKGDASDFKAIAEAAVSNLMMNAVSSSSGDDTTSEKDDTPPTQNQDKVDTSTAHVKALTGNNWVSVCAGATQGIIPATSTTDPKGGNRARRQNLTPDERARQNRDRNREHARNTRLRKKAYVEELKRTLTELVSQRDAAELEKRQTAQREMEQREVRFRVIEEFLKLRGRNETNFARWAAILEDGFTLTLPTTDLHKVLQREVEPGYEQVLNGVSDVMADAGVFAAFLQTLGNGENTVTCQYHCDRTNFFMDGCNAVLEWTATSIGAFMNGTSSELSFKGLIRGKFCPASNKLLSAQVTCDSGAILLQLNSFGTQESTETAANNKSVSVSQVAMEQADSVIKSIQVPHLPTQVPVSVLVHPSSSSSEGSCDDESESEQASGDKNISSKNVSSTKGAMSPPATRNSSS